MKLDNTSSKESEQRDAARRIVARLTPDERFDIAHADDDQVILHGIRITHEIRHAAYWYDAP
jgi:hypothetical protein